LASLALPMLAILVVQTIFMALYAIFVTWRMMGKNYDAAVLAATDWRQITDWHLSVYYVLNLVYHEPMQPELFRYLFPLCLA
ncbi:sodium/glutamate symporter, partial [Salmonella enterica]|uniref:sodium/glutamate symporter n=1 Tax=Salmonella enterica TaxID=28901 RepID=UPI002159E513